MYVTTSGYTLYTFIINILGDVIHAKLGLCNILDVNIKRNK